MKKIVVPGEFIGENKRIISGAYKKDGKIYAKYLGVLYESDVGIKVVPLNGKYEPKVGDTIIGIVLFDDPFTYTIDINASHYAVLPKRTMDVFLNKYDIVLLRVTGINEVKEVTIEYIDTLKNGNLLEINPKKVPRVIGKAKSMLNLIQEKTKTKMIVGANGYIYVIGENVDVVERVIKKIDRFSYVDQLTEHIGEFLEKILKE